MIKIIALVLFIALVNVDGWASCHQETFNNLGFECNRVTMRNAICKNSFSISTGCSNGCSTVGFYSVNGEAASGYCSGGVVTTRHNCNSYDDNPPSVGKFSGYYTVCGTKCESDSVAYYAECVARPNAYWDSDSCKCKESTEADSVFTVCTEDVRNGAPFYQIYVVNVHYKNGVLESACGVSPNLINGEGYKQYCALKRSGNGTCANAGVPNGPSDPKPCNGDCSQAGQEMVPTAECYAVVGYNCYLRDIRTGNTFRCECDGSCSKAMTDMLRPYENESNCRNPYNNPSSSDSGGGSPSSSDSGSSSPSSSDSGSSSPSSGTSGDYTEQLNQLIANTQGIMNNTGDISQWTQTTMNNTTDIKNSLSDIGIDVSHIRTNTENTANNTANIDNKLSTTNSLLNDIKNKEWNPMINVSPPEVNVNVAGDTNIVNVDTSKAPAEILGLLQNALQGEGNSSDTNGTGAQIDGWMRKIDSLIGDTSIIRMNGDSLNHAMENLYSGGYGAIRDTLGNSSIADSMDAWTNKLVDNGKISGDGSDQCPSILSRTWRVDFPIGNSTVGVDIGPLGRYLCNDVAGLGITFWALCRVILRSIVAIGCMIWLYKTVLGIDGGSNEED